MAVAVASDSNHSIYSKKADLHAVHEAFNTEEPPKVRK
jgi:hypothetical protein